MKPTALETFLEEIIKKMGFTAKYNDESILLFKLIASNGIICDVQLEIQNEFNSIFLIIVYPKIIEKKYAVCYADFFNYINPALDSKFVLSHSGLIVFKMNRLFNVSSYSENELIHYFQSNFDIFRFLFNHLDLIENSRMTNREILALFYSDLQNA